MAFYIFNCANGATLRGCGMVSFSLGIVSVLGLQPGEKHAGLPLPALRAGHFLYRSFAVPQRGGLDTRHSKDFDQFYFSG